MAKLNVTYPAVDVMVDGVAYRKIDRKAQAGDIVKITGTGFMDVETGAFYTVESGSDYGNSVDSIVDDGGVFRWGSLSNGKDWEVYEAVTQGLSESTHEITYEGPDGVAHYRKVDRSAREGDVIVFTEETDYITVGEPYAVTRIDGAGDAHVDDDDGDDLDTCGKEFDVYEKVTEPADQYREVKRKASVGERIKIVDAFIFSDYENGDEFEVVRVDEDGDVHITDNVGDSECVMPNEYVVLEPVNSQAEAESAAKPRRLTVGDYAKITDNIHGHSFNIGEVVAISEDDESRLPYEGRAHDGRSVSGDWFAESECEPATEAEFLAQRKPAEPTRLKVGDYAKVIDTSGDGNAKLGDIAEVTMVAADGLTRVKTVDGRTYGMFMRRFTLATPEEKAQAQAETKRKLAVGPFAGGGFAQIVDVTRGNASITPRSNPDAYVKVALAEHHMYALKVTLPDGDYGFCNADALRQITEEEYTVATQPKDPRDAFAKGDKVRLISGARNSGLYGFTDGEIYTVNNPKTTQWESKRIGIENGGIYGYALPDQLVKVTAEEIAAIEKEAQEIAKWAKIGRKVGEFKRGDIVSIVKSSGEKGVGTVEDGGCSGSAIGVRMGAKVWDGSAFYGVFFREGDSATLLVPVEQRFDTEQTAA